MRVESISGKNVKPNPSVVFTDLEDGSAVLLDLNSKFYYSLNETACFMWQTFEGEASTPVDRLVAKLVDQYEVSEDEAKSDVADFLGNLLKEGLVELS